MPPVEIKVSCPVFDSFRVQQVGGMFGVKKTGSARTAKFVKNYHGSTGRAVVSFEFVGNP